MIDKVKKQDCTLCKACANQCPQNCIKYEESYKSFNYPKIDYDKCIKCNLCEKVCPALAQISSIQPISYYGIKNKNKEILKISSSGGVFYSLARKIIDDRGIVVAAKFDEKFNVKHEACNKIEKIKEFCGSKYVQSDLTDCYKIVKKYLQQGVKVLFVGCSCQTAAMRQYFYNENNLLLVDFICHGIVSSSIFDEYKTYLEKKYGAKITKFEFRNKTNGWLFSGPYVEFANGKSYSSSLNKDLYMQGYFKNLNLKESCFTCQYKNFRSQSDITMGDYWDVQETDPEFYEYYGNSILVVNTKMGQDYLEKIHKEFEYKQIDLDTILKCNSSLVEPFQMNREREDYFLQAEKKGYIKPLEKYIKKSFMSRIKNKIKSYVRK